MNWFVGGADSLAHPQELLPIRLRRMASPSVRSLEPRFVLNATAELNALGQLVVMGTNAAESVELNVEADGKLRLRDGAGEVISIVGHPDGATGETNSLDAAAITSKEILFDLRGGNDVLRLALPSGLNIAVLESSGNDTVTVTAGSEPPISTDGLTIHSETIRFDPTIRSLAFENVVDLTGNVTLGNSEEETELTFGQGGFVVNGSLTVAGDVQLTGMSGPMDLSDAIVSSSSPESNLSIDAFSGDVLLGVIDGSSGSTLRDLQIGSAGSVNFDGPEVEISGSLAVRNVNGATTIDSTVDAGSISIVTDEDLTANGRLSTSEGGIELSAVATLSINENVDTTFATMNGDITLSGNEVQLDTVRILTSGGDVQVEGNQTISGLVIIDTGNRQGAAVAGNVNLFGNVQSADLNADVLRIDARGNQFDGDVAVTGSLGNTPDTPNALDLNGVIVDANRISVASIGVFNGDIRLTGNSITNFGNTIRTSGSGDILIDAPVLLGPADSTVSSAGSVRFTQSVQGQRSTENLFVNASKNALFDAAIAGIQELNITAVEVARFSGPSAIDGSMTVDAASIRVLGDVTTSNDAVTLTSTVQTLIASGAVIDVGDAMITIDAGGGTIDAGDGTLISLAANDAIKLRNASSLILGNTLAQDGNLRISNIAGSVTQSAGSSVIIDRLTVLQVAEVNLSNATNDVRSIEQIAANGKVTIKDSFDGLIVNRVDSTGNNVSISTTGGMLLGEVAVTALGATARIEALTINDLTDSTATDVSAQRVELKATQGIGNTSRVDLGGVSRLQAETISGGVNIAHIATGPLIAESITASDGTIQLTQGGHKQSLDLVNVQSGNGEIKIDAEGTITGRSVVSKGANQDITLTTTGDMSDILVGEIMALQESDVELSAGDDIRVFGDFNASLVRADDLKLVAANRSIIQDQDRNLAIELRTQVNDLTATTAGPNANKTNRGDIRIIELDDINLASSDAAGDEIVEAANGQIYVEAVNITVVDTGSVDPVNNRKGDPEILASGVMGRVVIKASEALTISDDVQIYASKTTPMRPDTLPLLVPVELASEDRAVVLSANAVVFGNDIEIFTGNDQGTARVFGPRPSVIPDDVTTERPIKLGPTRNGNQQLDDNGNVIPSAFYDPDSISVNVLEQAAVNDANGILTVDIGRPGERGLTVEIDWGAGMNAVGDEDPNRRYQQINNLSADENKFFDVDLNGNPLQSPTKTSGSGKLSVTHLYRQDDILNSDFNGRTPGTGPLNVLFAVRHHESILVEANSITQQGETDIVPQKGTDPGIGLVSSTDDRSTARNAEPGLESGSASFIIPSLSIPVAFFPVREVIPEVETQQFIVRSVSTATIAQTTVETVESTTTSTSTREEFFRLRVLSPDPDGEDLAEPEKLPEDILDVEKLRAMFKRLPDGTYEIEYVLGDGDERTILRVEVRNGAAKLSAGDLEEGVLELKRLKDTDN